MLNCLKIAKVPAMSDASDVDGIENIDRKKEKLFPKTKEQALLYLYL